MIDRWKSSKGKTVRGAGKIIGYIQSQLCSGREEPHPREVLGPV